MTRAAYQKEWKRRPAVAARLKTKRASAEYKQARLEEHLRRAYGITIAERDALLARQGGGCAICKKPVVFGRGFSDAGHVDHCHETGKVRGILCARCNSALGKLGDSVESIRKEVLAYLEGEAA